MLIFVQNAPRQCISHTEPCCFPHFHYTFYLIPCPTPLIPFSAAFFKLLHVVCTARYTVRTFSIRRNEKIAAHVTIRGERAAKILELGLKVKEYELKSKNFSLTGTPFWLTRFMSSVHGTVLWWEGEMLCLLVGCFAAISPRIVYTPVDSGCDLILSNPALPL